MMRPSEWLRKERTPWTFPLIALVALLIIVIGGTVLALVFAGCAAQPGTRGTSESDDSGSIKSQTSTTGMEERKVTLSDGRIITCITWVDSGYQYENTAAGISCDFSQAVTSGE